MAFQKGHKKLANSGRKKGTPNKKTLNFKDKLSNFDTVEELITLYNETDDLNLKFHICKEFLKYEYPQRKAIDIESTNDNGFTIIVADETHRQMLEDL